MSFLCLFSFTISGVLFCVSLDQFIPTLLAFVVSASVSSVEAKRLAWVIRPTLCREERETLTQFRDVTLPRKK